MWEWYQARKVQQITEPLDDNSRAVLRVVQLNSTGSATKTLDINLTGNVQTITVPAAYGGTVLIEAGGVTYEVPYIQTV